MDKKKYPIEIQLFPKIDSINLVKKTNNLIS